MFSGIWRKVKKKNMKKERKFGLKEFPRPLMEEIGGKRHKFPVKGGTHQGRWCSGSLKAAVQDSVTSNLEKTRTNKKILIVSGERRGESAGRSRYNEMLSLVI